VAANKAKLANNGLNKGSPDKCDCEHPANKGLKKRFSIFRRGVQQSSSVL
jgi:hypothetical protein